MTNDWEFRSDLYKRLLTTWVGVALYWWIEPSDYMVVVSGSVLVLAFLADRMMTDTGGEPDS